MLLVMLTAVAMIAAPLLAMLFAPGFVQFEEKMALTSDLLRLTFPYLLLISLTAFAGSVLNSYGRFAVPAFTPVLLNLSLIGCALLMAPMLDNPVMALGWGVLIAGAVQLLFQLPFLARLHLLPRPRVDRKHEGVRQIIKLMIPALFGVSVSQINLLLDTVLASFLPTGSVSWLYYSDRLAELPLGVFGIAIATVILPNLSAHRAASREGQFSLTLDWAMRSVLLIGVPAAVALILLAKPILITLFQYGALTPSDVDMAALSMRAYSLGLIAFMLVKVLAPGFYARKDTATPVKIGIVAMVANMVMNLLFVVPLMYYWNIGHLGLALATSVAAYLNAGLLLRGLLRAGVYQFQPGWQRYIARLLVATGSMAAVVLLLAPDSSIWLEWHWQRRTLEIGLVCGGGIAAYLLTHVLLGTRFKHLRAPSVV
jgi:putative peptidoglycan lipid II flippase